ncbi:MAG: hypothetical protein Q9204_003513, partial [Flavoplaca sp. TL-2023a]
DWDTTAFVVLTADMGGNDDGRDGNDALKTRTRNERNAMKREERKTQGENRGIL